MRDFRKLEIWKDAVAFAGKIYQLIVSFPVHEKYGLSSQMNRAVVSISSNIAEGCSRKTNIDFSRFLNMAWDHLSNSKPKSKFATRLRI